MTEPKTKEQASRAAMDKANVARDKSFKAWLKAETEYNQAETEWLQAWNEAQEKCALRVTPRVKRGKNEDSCDLPKRARGNQVG